MADKYCDHGLYGACAFTASRSTTTLTVTAVGSGRLGLGSVIWTDTSGDIAEGYFYISAFGTGTGGTGTYTLAAFTGVTTGTTTSQSMLGKFANLAIIPSWGIASEGDGTAMGAATSATVSVDLTGATADAGDTISVMGAVLTCVASGATVNQFNAGSGATLVSNLVTAINRTTNTSTVAAQGTGWATPKIQDAVFARIGSPTTTLQIMTRAGSAQYNSSLVAQAGIVGVTGPWTFSGGAGGAWGYIFNANSTTGPSAMALATYGLWGAAQVLAGVQDAGDVVRFRCGKIVSLSNVQYAPAPPASIGTEYLPVVHEFTTNTVWVGDSATAALEFQYVGINSNSFLLPLGTATALHVRGTPIGSGSWSLKVTQIAGTSTAGVGVSMGAGNNLLSGFNIACLTAIGQAATTFTAYGANNTRMGRIENGVFSHPKAGAFMTAVGTGGYYGARFRGVTFDNSGQASPNAGVFPSHAQGTLAVVDLSGCKFTNFVANSRLFPAGTAMGGSRYLLSECSLGGVTVRGPVFAGALFDNLTLGFCSSFSSSGLRDFWIDGQRGMVSWNSSISQPALGALLPDGVTRWSYMLSPGTVNGNITLGAPLETPAVYKLNTLTSGSRTFTAEFCVGDTLVLDRSKVSFLVEYATAGGEQIALDSWDVTGAALTASTVIWGNAEGSPQESGGQVTFSNGSTLLHNKYKIQVSTPAGSDLPLGATVKFIFRLHTAVVTSNELLFVDPDFGIT